MKMLNTHCLRCGGTLYLDKDIDGDWYESCLQCGNIIWLPRVPKVTFNPDDLKADYHYRPTEARNKAIKAMAEAHEKVPYICQVFGLRKKHVTKLLKEMGVKLPERIIS
jgi:hypothetical protein